MDLTSLPTTAVGRPRLAAERLLDAATAVFAEERVRRRDDGCSGRARRHDEAHAVCALWLQGGPVSAAVEREFELRKTRLFEAYGTEQDTPFRERLHTWVAVFSTSRASAPTASR